MRYFLEIAYNGSAYHGWQKQPNAVSVQELVESALSTIFGALVDIVGAGRTDAGVHAKQLFAHFDTETDFSLNDYRYKLNSILPKDIVVKKIQPVTAEAHARFDAIARTYLYRIALEKDVFNYNEAYFYKKKLDLQLLNKATQELFNYTNFQCFSKLHTNVKTYDCTIMKAVWEEADNELHFTIQANRFLRNMVRAIVGTLLDVGSKKITIEEFNTIINSKNRNNAGTSVPAHALYLTEVTYPETLFINV